ncbi:GNAT family N-acetyltransferase [Streptomyces sp. NPDC056682]|uniref:GNAT family N-acetyltransferase n=1 Tax=Streptomyces sp. NPDC056682 TaxID=3345909 RepID=UPI0036AA70FF
MAVGRPLSPYGDGKSLKQHIDAHGGEFSVMPFGKVRAIVVERETRRDVCGLALVLPPGQLIRQYADQGSVAQRSLSVAVAEIDLLAVDPDVRGQGLGTALLSEAEQWLANRKCRVVTAKIARGDFQVMRWYRRRGYLVAAQGEHLCFSMHNVFLDCDDGNDGYQMAIKGLGGTSIRRAQRGSETYVTVEGQKTISADRKAPARSICT